LNKLFIILVTIFGFNVCFAQAPTNTDSAASKDSESKIYIPQEYVTLHNNKIFAQINNQWFQVKTLHSDEKGVYVEGKDLPLGAWRCDNCGRGNPPWNLVCYWCRTPR
jgi:hypothetical protein